MQKRGEIAGKRAVPARPVRTRKKCYHREKTRERGHGRECLKNGKVPAEQIQEQQPGEILFSSVLSELLICRQSNVKASTLARYREIIRLHLRPAFGNVRVREINTQMIEKFANEKMEQGRPDSAKALSPKRVRDILSVIKLALAYAKEQGYISHAIHFSMPRTETPHIDIFSKEDEARLLSYLVEHCDPARCGVLLSLCTGLRIGEMCALQWSDIDIKCNTIHIRKTLQRIPDPKAEHKTKIIIESPKTRAGERAIPIPAFLREPLRAIRPRGNASDSYVLTAGPKFIEPSNYYAKYKRWLHECGIKAHSFHALRHTFATRAVECGMDIKTLSEILGHSDVKITLARYVHPSMELKSLNMKKMNAYLCGQLNRSLERSQKEYMQTPGKKATK